MYGCFAYETKILDVAFPLLREFKFIVSCKGQLHVDILRGCIMLSDLIEKAIEHFRSVVEE